ncbi:MAG: hypothetical protein JXB46_01770, partial [Candidatus Eisenbacteria bacterium]|nr:hypothetical protein [Candidatus Eisenbacteria bacterium]
MRSALNCRFRSNRPVARARNTAPLVTRADGTVLFVAPRRAWLLVTMVQMALIVLAVSAAPARAGGDPGLVRRTILRHGDRGPVVSRVLFVGNDTFSADELVPYMHTRESGLLTLNRYQRRTLLQDLDNLERFYASQGFLTAEVALDDISLSADSTRVELLIGVREGDRWMVREQSFSGNRVFSDEELSALTRLEEGGPFMADRLPSGRRAILEAYAGRSYLDARVDQTVERDDENRSASVSYRISEESQAVISSIEITGNEKTRGFVISRELQFEPGEHFDFEKIGESQARLYRTGLFNSVWIEPAEADTGRADKSVVVRVSERPSGAVDFTLGYAAIDGPEVGAGINNRNVQGQATSIRLDGRYSELSRSGRASVGDPWFLGRPVAAEVSSHYEWSDEESFIAETASASFLLTKKFGLTVVVDGGYEF